MKNQNALLENIRKALKTSDARGLKMERSLDESRLADRVSDMIAEFIEEQKTVVS